MTFETITYDVSDRILTITLNRPDRLNAFTPAMARDLIKAVDMADADDEVRVIVVTGAGRAFCAGADLAMGGETFKYDAGGKEPDWQAVRDIGGLVTLRFFNSRKPMIGAINGPAVGIGATMLLPMDMRLAARDAKMGFVFCRRGIVPDGGASWLLPRVVGLPQSLEWVLTGRVFAAEEGHRAGLVRSLHEPDALLPSAYELAQEIAENTSAVSVALSRQMLWRLSAQDHPMHAHEVETRAIYYTGLSADAMEGVMSFMQKRPPQFKLSPSTDMPPCYPWWTEPEFS